MTTHVPDRNRRLQPGDPAPWFNAPALSGNPRYGFNTAAGRHILLLFFGSAGRAACRTALRLVTARRDLLDDDHACFFGVTVDPEDAEQGRIMQLLPGIRYFLDYDLSISIAYGALKENGVGPIEQRYDAHWLLLNPGLQVIASYNLDQGDQALRDLASLVTDRVDDGWAPVILVPRVFEPELCRHLINLFEQAGGTESGFMSEVDGKTVRLFDHDFKRRSDWTIEDAALKRGLAARIQRRLIPRIERAFQFHATRMERYIVGCYDSRVAGHFQPHRDNTTKGTAHRRFAVTINLNAEDYDGGELCFPEFGSGTYRPPTGGAVVFSCSLLHEARPVTRGCRYAFLPFLYDEAAARQRQANNIFLDADVSPYCAGPASS